MVIGRSSATCLLLAFGAAAELSGANQVLWILLESARGCVNRNGGSQRERQIGSF